MYKKNSYVGGLNFIEEKKTPQRLQQWPNNEESLQPVQHPIKKKRPQFGLDQLEGWPKRL